MTRRLSDLPAGAVVVGVDGSEPAEHAAAWAAEVAGREHRPLVLAHGVHRALPLAPEGSWPGRASRRSSAGRASGSWRGPRTTSGSGTRGSSRPRSA
ncbi:universal stress protein [Nocardioides humi]|uniref:universal stress protein n=1 Tax=Nocardioides humi TaxID=449461 RepID=UPI0015E86764